MKANCLIPKRYFVAAALMLLGVLVTCYDVGANLRRGSEPRDNKGPDILRAENDDNPEYREQHREFLRRFFGNREGGLSAREYKHALAEARALPRSALLEGRVFESLETPELMPSWSSPIEPPILNSYGGNASAAVYSLAIDPINANVVYTGSFGGLAKTTDGGTTWRYLSDSWNSQSVSAIAINPGASNDVYVGTGREGAGYSSYEVGIYRSFDGGSTWSSPLGQTPFKETDIRAIAIEPNGSVYVANGCDHHCGLWRSNDSGVTWSPLYQFDDGVYDVAIDATTQPSTLYLTGQSGVFKSTDSGHSWTLIHHVLHDSRNRLSVVNSTLYVLEPLDPDHNLYKSTDRGATWIQIPTNCPAGADSCDDPNGSIGFSVFAVDSTNPQNIVAGNLALYRTNNEGVTWTEIGHAGGDPEPSHCIHPDQRVIAFSQTTVGVLYVGNDGGMTRSTNAGQDWTNLNQNLPGALLYGVALSRDGTMIAGTQDNGVIFSDPLMPWGRTWSAIHGGDSAHNLIDPIDSRVAYLTMYATDPQHQNIWRVTRAIPGTTPAPEAPIRPSQFDDDCACNFFPTFSMNPLSPKHLVAACQRVVRTLDGTASSVVWTTIGNGPLTSASPCAMWNSVTAATEAPNNSNVIYAVTHYDTVFVTQNANAGPGATWNQVTQQHHPDSIWGITVDPRNYQIAYLACDSGVYKTTNMGASWTQYGIPNLIYRDVAIDPPNPQHIFAASNAGVFASTDGGLTWGNMSQGIPAGMMVSALSFNAASRQLAASTYGRGVYVLNFGQPAPRPRR